MRLARLSSPVTLLALAALALTAIWASSGSTAHAAGANAEIFFRYLRTGETVCTNHPTTVPAKDTLMNIQPASVPAEIKVCVYAKGVTTKNAPADPPGNPRGLGGAAGFNLDFTYHNDFMAVSGWTGTTTWLNSTGRAASCPPQLVEALEGDPENRWRFLALCVSYNPTPAGPLGGNLLGTITLVPSGDTGQTILTHTNTFLTRVSAGEDPTIPTTSANLTIRVVRCADFPNAGNPPNGVVSIADISALVGHFGQTPAHPQYDSIYDLNENSAVDVGDILLTVLQFGVVCPA